MEVNAIISTEVPFGVALNALAHASLGLAAKAKLSALLPSETIPFSNSAGGFEFAIASVRLIESTSGGILAERSKRLCSEALYVDFVDTMTGDTYVEQLARTKLRPTGDLKYYAAVAAKMNDGR
jgi:hypothetical protein